MITKYKRKAAGVAVALLVLAGCGSEANTSSDPVTTEAGSGTTATTSTGAAPGSSSSTTATVPGGSDEPAKFGGDFPPPEGSTLKRDRFAIGSDGLARRSSTSVVAAARLMLSTPTRGRSGRRASRSAESSRDGPTLRRRVISSSRSRPARTCTRTVS